MAIEPRRRSTGPVSRRGTAYVIVLGTTMIVAALAATALTTTRIRHRYASESIDASIARQCAADGIEAARLWIRKDAAWRTTRTAGVWATNLPMGAGSVTIEVSDPVDGNLARGRHDAVIVKSTGKMGSARFIQQVTLQAQPIPLAALAYAAHTDGEFHVLAGKTLKSAGATISANVTLRNDGTITGAINVKKVDKLGTVLGSPNVTNADIKADPPDSVIDNYVAMGTLITTPPTIQNAVLAPGYNPFGPTNPDGIYVIRPPGDLTIKTARLQGTIVIITTGKKKVTIDDRILIHPYRIDMPTLIIDGDAEFVYYSDNTSLSEASAGISFNPRGAPYDGQTNGNKNETYPSEIQGLVHITGKLSMKQTARIRGAVIAQDNKADAIKIEDTPELIYTPSLFTNPPQWYTTEVRMPTLTGSWRQPAN